jgi:hypothetical protein
LKTKRNIKDIKNIKEQIMKVWKAEKISGVSNLEYMLNDYQKRGYKIEAITEAGSCCYTIIFTIEDEVEK